MSTFKISHTSPQTQIYREISVRDAVGRTPGSGEAVHIMAENITLHGKAKVAGMVLQKDDARALAHDILARIGEPVTPPAPPYVRLADRIGQYVQGNLAGGSPNEILRITQGKPASRSDYTARVLDNAVGVRENGGRVEIYNELDLDGDLVVEWWKPVSVRITEKWEVQA